MPAPLIAIEIVVGFGLPILWGVGQLVSLRRERKRDAERDAAAEATEPAQGDPQTEASKPD